MRTKEICKLNGSFFQLRNLFTFFLLFTPLTRLYSMSLMFGSAEQKQSAAEPLRLYFKLDGALLETFNMDGALSADGAEIQYGTYEM